LSSHGTGQGGWGGLCAAAPEPLEGLVPSDFSSVVGHHSEFRQVGVLLGFGGERGREAKRRGKQLLPLRLRVQGKKKTYGAVQTGTVFASSLFFQ